MIKDKIDINNLPTHIAIIMDGNGRWAKRRGNKRIAGHKSGVNAVRAVSEAAAEIGIKNVTLYTFSTENWNRPKQEVDILMDLLVKAINSETDTLMKNNIRLTCIGDITRLPENNLNKLNEVMAKTKDNTRLNLTLALSYSSRWEITEAVKSIAEKIRSNEINIDDITEDYISASLSTKDIPDPDLLIRTSGEYRLSNFLLWQSAYTELYFTDVLWPDFNKEVFYEAIYEYQNRERRFGKTSEQIN